MNEDPVAALRTIREFELEMAQRIEAAEAAANETLRRARADERAGLAEAEQRGRAEADRRIAEAITAAEADARNIRAEGRERVQDLHRNVAGNLKEVVDQLVDLVLAPPLEKGK